MRKSKLVMQPGMNRAECIQKLNPPEVYSRAIDYLQFVLPNIYRCRLRSVGRAEVFAPDSKRRETGIEAVRLSALTQIFGRRLQGNFENVAERVVQAKSSRAAKESARHAMAQTAG
jgi:hypothetical protein